ncbi:hypothetical protein RAA17_08430 [Komagataeibacter rhaeticus]|nr:hypothetical protein [Komagataeibacter rhaeticus]
METSGYRNRNVTETPSTFKLVLFYLLLGVMFQVFIFGLPGIQYITFHTFLHVVLWPLFVAYYFVIAALALAGIWIIAGIVYFLWSSVLLAIPVTGGMMTGHDPAYEIPENGECQLFENT